MDLLRDIGNRYRDKREKEGFTRRDVAIYTRLAITDVLRLENGESFPPYQIFDDMCRAIRTTAHDLLKVYKWTYTEPKKEELNHDAA